MARELSPQARSLAIKFDVKLVTKDITRLLREQISEESRIPVGEKRKIEGAAIEATRRGGELSILFNALKETGLSKGECLEICNYIHNRARLMIDLNRMKKLNIKEATWKHSGAPCANRHSIDKSMTVDQIHRSFDNRKFILERGLVHDGKKFLPGWAIGCKCTFAIVFPGFDN